MSLLASVRVIANPNAAGGRAARVLPRLEAELKRAGIPFTLRRTEGPGHARELAREARADGPGPVLVVGGDGTVHEVAGGLAGAGAVAGGTGPSEPPPPMAVLPVGTGNDFHRMLRSPGTLEGIPRLLRDGVPRAFEVGIARWNGGSSPFVNLVGIGIDVEVLRRRGRFAALSGLPQYLAALAVALANFRPIPVTIRVRGGDGKEREIRAPVLLSAVTVGPSVGGGFILAPKARPDDGCLDLFVAERMGPARIARYLPSVLRGTLESAPGFHTGTVHRVEIRAAAGSRVAFELDGELGPVETDFLEIEVLPAGLRVLDFPEDTA